MKIDFDFRVYELCGPSTPLNPLALWTQTLDFNPKPGDIVQAIPYGDALLMHVVPKEVHPQKRGTLLLAIAPPKRIAIGEIQTALSALIGRVAQGGMTHKKFFEAMEAWERCFRKVPEGDYNKENLLKLATSHCF